MTTERRTYIIYLRTGRYGHKGVYCMLMPDEATEDTAIARVRGRYHSDGAKRVLLRMFVGTPAEAREQVDALAALNDATAQTGVI